MNHINEIVIGITGVVTATAAWMYGGKQKNKNEENDTLTSGTAKIVDTSNQLLDRLTQLLEQETDRVAEERKHRESCEKSLSEHKQMILELVSKVKSLETAFKKK
jgi:ATP-dependent protease HslVU (ClpYQ) peptidase subunit